MTRPAAIATSGDDFDRRCAAARRRAAWEPELLDADEPFIVGALRELDRRGIVCRSAGHL